MDTRKPTDAELLSLHQQFAKLALERMDKIVRGEWDPDDLNELQAARFALTVLSGNVDAMKGMIWCEGIDTLPEPRFSLDGQPLVSVQTQNDPWWMAESDARE